MKKSFVEKYREILRRASLKATHTRLRVAQYLVQTSGLITIGEVMRGVETVSWVSRRFSEFSKPSHKWVLSFFTSDEDESCNLRLSVRCLPMNNDDCDRVLLNSEIPLFNF